MKTDFAKNGYYYNFFGDLMCFIHQVFTAPEENASGIFYHGTAGFYHKYPKPYTSAILLAIDHELVRRPYIPKLSEEQYKAFLKDYYILLKDVLGVKVEQLSVDELCTYTLSQMDVLTRKYQNFSTNSEAWKFGHGFLLAAVEEVDRTVLESAA